VLLVLKHQLNHGELVEQYLVSLESQVEVHTDLDKELLETCVVEVVCLHQTKSGEDGTLKLVEDKEDLQQSLLSLLQLLLL
jgi:hypothetical protein